MKQSKKKSMTIFFLILLMIASFGLAAIKGVNVGSKTFGNVKSHIRQGLDLKLVSMSYMKQKPMQAEMN